ncbi:unnamed protein product [Clonostachys rhizophaga]|uniref:Uncharacterized protein n=1 Tax=Clonostachys rhizophaga TaxID=160324 RepID=A0A9N9VLE6_9HYPO|nr:unnamed protein product [Clonostachys rhizophaga]
MCKEFLQQLRSTTTLPDAAVYDNVGLSDGTEDPELPRDFGRGNNGQCLGPVHQKHTQFRSRTGSTVTGVLFRDLCGVNVQASFQLDGGLFSSHSVMDRDSTMRSVPLERLIFHVRLYIFKFYSASHGSKPTHRMETGRLRGN